MIKIVNIIGGIGNQMFQYALYLKLKNEYKNIFIDISEFENYKLHQGYELKKVFNINIEPANLDIINKYKDSKNDILSILKRKLFGLKKTMYIENNINYKENFINSNNQYLWGYWQSEKYFINIKNQILNTYDFKIELKDKNLILFEEIRNNKKNASIHIRRGDYINSTIHTNLSETDYYEKSINYISNIILNCIFYIFSDDTNWVKNKFNISNAKYIDWNIDINSHYDMHLMSLCSNNIIANSSFSWWAAYLNKNPNKIVIAPKYWFKNNCFSSEDLIPEEWIII